MIVPPPPPYDPHGGYPVPPLKMTAQAPLPPHNGYAPLQGLSDGYRMLMHMIDQWEWTLAPSAYTEIQRQLCSDGKTLKGDCLVVNHL
ncbi:hypothetical protein MKW92_022193 [Papaver armeniacum]|nr:hypothetical protein MKW92_022193 [Papaver armeniacum]